MYYVMTYIAFQLLGNKKVGKPIWCEALGVSDLPLSNYDFFNLILSA